MTERIRKGLICEAWPINIMLPAPGSERELPRQERSFLSWMKEEDVPFISLHASALESLLRGVGERLKKRCRVIEYFGGAGIDSTTISEMLSPSRHVVIDRSPYAIAQLEQLPLKAQLLKTSFEEYLEWISFDTGEAFDFHHIDHPMFSAARIREYHLYFSRVFGQGPAVVSLTDTSLKKFHLNRKYFENRLKTEVVTHEDYLRAVSSRLYDLFGYSAEFVFVFCGMAMFAFTPGKHDLLIIGEECLNPKGFQWTDIPRQRNFLQGEVVVEDCNQRKPTPGASSSQDS